MDNSANSAPFGTPRLVAGASLPPWLGQRLQRRGVLQAAVAAAGPLAAGQVLAAHAELPQTHSLPDALTAALGRGNPLIVMVSLKGCPFCQIARDSYLAPLIRDQGASVVQVDLRNDSPLKDFAGHNLTQDDVARAWKIQVVPTVLFFGRNAVEVAERLEGGYIPDFYGVYLDERVRVARAAVQR